MLRNLFKKRATSLPLPRVSSGMRVYAIGDVHGRLDLLDRLLDMIARDGEKRGPARTMTVLLGDLIDRGPESAGVVERLRRYAIDHPDSRFVMGNHEEVFLQALAGDERALRGFCRIGGRDTVLSYGIQPDDYDRMSYEQVAAALDEAVPASHVAFLRSFSDHETIGDYMFVHAGVRPSAALDAQSGQDLRWIREPFLSHPSRLGKMIVHGHTIAPDVVWQPHRIGIDTGAHGTGKLTALGLEGDLQWLLQT
jgi:serine/threonine protein phosphatase 1